MSILLIVLAVLAIIHFFYQSVILRTSNELFENDILLLQHEVEIFEIKNANSLNVSEKEFLEETKNFIEVCPLLGKNVTAVEMIYDLANFKVSKEYEGHGKRVRSLKVLNETIWEANVQASRYMVRNITSNASLLLFACSPFLFLVFLYSIVSGNKLSLEQSLERISSKHC